MMNLNRRQLVAAGAAPAIFHRAAKAAVGKFAKQIKPHLAIAEETDVTIAIENHDNNIIDSPDSLKWLVELCPRKQLRIALAPYHLEQDPQSIGERIRTLGNRIAMFYAWQHAVG